MGRPPKAEKDRASAQLALRLTQAERKQLDWLAYELRAASAGAVLRIALAELYAKTKKGRKDGKAT